jgi:DNA-directed RNA polymerase subunit H
MSFEVNKHSLVPKHQKLSDSEKNKLLDEYHIEIKSLPKISKEDPAVAILNAQAGDVIKIERDSLTAGKTIYYRVVIEG